MRTENKLLTPHFTLHELAYSGTMATSNEAIPPVIASRLERVAQRLEQVRTLLGGHPIYLTSGWRSRRVNRIVGGSPTSDHPFGWCADFHMRAWPPEKIGQVIAESELAFDQLIIYRTHVHLSVNPKGRRQVFRG